MVWSQRVYGRDIGDAVAGKVVGRDGSGSNSERWPKMVARGEIARDMFQGLQENQLSGAIEAMLFVTDEPVGTITLAEMLECDVAAVEAALVGLRADLEARGSGIQLREVAGGWRLFTHPAYHELIEKYVLSWDTRKLSAAAMETLAIVAYTQPVTRAGVASVRGVNSDSPLNSLVEKGLVREVGAADTPGNPTLYGTTRGFLEKFGLRSPADLPNLADFAPDEETRRLITERLSATREDAVVSDEQARLMARNLMEADEDAADGEAMLFDEEVYVGLDAAADTLVRVLAEERAAVEGGPAVDDESTVSGGLTAAERVAAEEGVATEEMPGAEGTPGAQGAPGTEGVSGAEGTPGAEEMPGAQGAPRTVGTPGTQGAPGAEEMPGVQGAPRTEGAPGAQGAPGAVAAPLAGSRSVSDGRSPVPESAGVSGPVSDAAAEAMFAKAIASTLGVVDKIDFDSLTFETDDE